jgi:2-dehydro-3-deoxyphosphooctonate aldolase (KDO 8-P synthase)
LAKAAVAVGINALFLEVHDDPDMARCDGPNMISLETLQAMLPALLKIDAIVKRGE